MMTRFGDKTIAGLAASIAESRAASRVAVSRVCLGNGMDPGGATPTVPGDRFVSAKANRSD